jgi:hypothetical protein
MYKMISANNQEVYVDLTAIKLIRKAYHHSEPVSVIEFDTEHNIKIKKPELRDLIHIVSDAKHNPYVRPGAPPTRIS